MGAGVRSAVRFLSALLAGDEGLAFSCRRVGKHVLGNLINHRLDFLDGASTNVCEGLGKGFGIRFIATQQCSYSL